jgi:hypothetical protein
MACVCSLHVLLAPTQDRRAALTCFFPHISRGSADQQNSQSVNSNVSSAPLWQDIASAQVAHSDTIGCHLRCWPGVSGHSPIGPSLPFYCAYCAIPCRSGIHGPTVHKGRDTKSMPKSRQVSMQSCGHVRACNGRERQGCWGASDTPWQRLDLEVLSR